MDTQKKAPAIEPSKRIIQGLRPPDRTKNTRISDEDDESNEEEEKEKKLPFSSALDKLQEDDAKKGKATNLKKNTASNNNTRNKRTFNSPRGPNDSDPEPANKKKKKTSDSDNESMDHPLYKNVDASMVERIENEILSAQLNVHWSDIAGLEDVKCALNEMIILPHRNPEIFTGLRQPPKGLLLFGPPGNGKTMIAKAVATEANLTFFSISAATLTSKWIGEGEKMVKALFAVARAKQPSFIFIDEIDSILSARGAEEHESTRRLKTEFLVQFDGATMGTEEDRITVMGATNRPQDLDEAARRRLPKRIYVPLPEYASRRALLELLIKKERHSLSAEDLDLIATSSEGYSANDLSYLCKDAAMGPVREATLKSNFSSVRLAALRPLNIGDFQVSLKKMKPSVSPGECKHYEDWNQQFGSSGL
uniref:AAA+ ATPase domain-containing protein n=1 Tax=Arcella intermedia TaxID=1963864 RepID=A0A6B2L2C0_9EUKA